MNLQSKDETYNNEITCLLQENIDIGTKINEMLDKNDEDFIRISNEQKKLKNTNKKSSSIINSFTNIFSKIKYSFSKTHNPKSINHNKENLR